METLDQVEAVTNFDGYFDKETYFLTKHCARRSQGQVRLVNGQILTGFLSKI